jgi:hypothetical protein
MKWLKVKMWVKEQTELADQIRKHYFRTFLPSYIISLNDPDYIQIIAKQFVAEVFEVGRFYKIGFILCQCFL